VAGNWHDGNPACDLYNEKAMAGSMRYKERHGYMKRQRSFLQNFAWVGIMLLAMGFVFLSVAVGSQYILTDPSSVNYYVNGIKQPDTMETLQSARLLFLLLFGGFGLGAMIPGFVICLRAWLRGKQIRRLKAEGEYLSARNVGLEPTAVRINRQPLMRLRCAYTDNKGTTYVFKSASLRCDPEPFLADGKVDVYYDRNDMSCYFVDVDGSIGLGERVVEL